MQSVQWSRGNLEVGKSKIRTLPVEKRKLPRYRPCQKTLKETPERHVAAVGQYAGKLPVDKSRVGRGEGMKSIAEAPLKQVRYTKVHYGGALAGTCTTASGRRGNNDEGVTRRQLVGGEEASRGMRGSGGHATKQSRQRLYARK